MQADLEENMHVVVQILRANEALDVEALRTFSIFRMLDQVISDTAFGHNRHGLQERRD